MKVVIVIPARLASSRLPEKLVLDQTGKTLLEHTYLAARQSQLADDVVVATDSEKIASAVHDFGGTAYMTSEAHSSGTDRIAECVQKIEADLIVNVQGDEPEIEGAAIDEVIRCLLDAPDAAVATLATPIANRQDFENPNCVKVVFDVCGKALYFSRSPIPFPRDEAWLDRYFETFGSASKPELFQHVGIYAYRREFLRRLSGMPKVASESIESLEQLRFLAHGWHIQVALIDHPVRGIDTAEDYALFVNRYKNG